MHLQLFIILFITINLWGTDELPADACACQQPSCAINQALHFAPGAISAIQDALHCSLPTLHGSLHALQKQQGRLFVKESNVSCFTTKVLCALHEKFIQMHTVTPQITISRCWSAIGHRMLLGQGAIDSVDELYEIVKTHLQTQDPRIVLYILMLHSDYMSAKRNPVHCKNYRKIFESQKSLGQFLYAVNSRLGFYTSMQGDRWADYILDDAVEALACIKNSPPPVETEIDVSILLNGKNEIGSLRFLMGILNKKFIIPIKPWQEGQDLFCDEGIIGRASLLTHYLHRYFKMDTIANLWRKTFDYHSTSNNIHNSFLHIIDACLEAAKAEGASKSLLHFTQNISIIRIIFCDALPIPCSDDIVKCLTPPIHLQNSRIMTTLQALYSDSWPSEQLANAFVHQKVTHLVSSIPQATLEKFIPQQNHTQDLCQSWGISAAEDTSCTLVHLLAAMQKKFALQPPITTQTQFIFHKTPDVYTTNQSYILAFLHYERIIIILPQQETCANTPLLQSGFKLITSFFEKNHLNLAKKILKKCADSAHAYSSSATLECVLHQQDILQAFVNLSLF